MVSLFQRGGKQGHARKVNKMLKVVFTRSSYSSCLHNMVAVFPPYPPTPKIKKLKPARKFPTTGWSSPCGFLTGEQLTAFTSSAYHQADNIRGLN